MLDVHPPHHPTHTWKDFFIHIATIVVGLLIAVGLEQTVEAVHHQQQRRELLEGLRREAEENTSASSDSLRLFAATRRWSGEALEDMLHARASGPLLLPPYTGMVGGLPSKVIWDAAISSGEINLLDSTMRSQLALEYGFLDRVSAAGSGFEPRATELLYRLGSLLGPARRETDGAFDLTTADAEQRRRITETLVDLDSAGLGAMRQNMWLNVYSTAALKFLQRDDREGQDELSSRRAELERQYPEMHLGLVSKTKD